MKKKIQRIFLNILKYSKNISHKAITKAIKKQADVTHVISFSMYIFSSFNTFYLLIF